MSTFTITIPGVPSACPYCGHEADHWPLRYHAGEVILACPNCHSRVGRVVAVSGEPGDGHETGLTSLPAGEEKQGQERRAMVNRNNAQLQGLR